jgi:hypothetical protein
MVCDPRVSLAHLTEAVHFRVAYATNKQARTEARVHTLNEWVSVLGVRRLPTAMCEVLTRVQLTSHTQAETCKSGALLIRCGVIQGRKSDLRMLSASNHTNACKLNDNLTR